MRELKIACGECAYRHTNGGCIELGLYHVELDFGCVSFVLKCEPTYEPKHGMWLRRELGDYDSVVENLRRPVAWHVGHADRVLDLGANVGAFSVGCARAGAGVVVAVEADPGNWHVLAKNLGVSVDLVRAAIGPTNGEVMLWRTTNLGLSSVLARKGRILRTRVPMISFGELYERHRFTVIKCDVEGAEYQLDWSIIGDETRLIHLELHRPTKVSSESRATQDRLLGFTEPEQYALRDSIKARGFTEHVQVERVGFIEYLYNRPQA